MRKVGDNFKNLTAGNGVTADLINRTTDNPPAGKGVIIRTLCLRPTTEGDEYRGIIEITDGTTTLLIHGIDQSKKHEGLGYELLIPPGWSVQATANRASGTGTYTCDATWDDVL